MADARELLTDAERHGTEDEKRTARERYDLARDRMAMIAAMVFGIAVGDYGSDLYTPRQSVWARLGQRVGVDLLKQILGDYQRLTEVLSRNLDRVHAIENRVAELERRLDNLTPGVGEK